MGLGGFKEADPSNHAKRLMWTTLFNHACVRTCCNLSKTISYLSRLVWLILAGYEHIHTWTIKYSFRVSLSLSFHSWVFRFDVEKMIEVLLLLLLMKSGKNRFWNIWTLLHLSAHFPISVAILFPLYCAVTLSLATFIQIMRTMRQILAQLLVYI